ncbi:MAG: hypothetical protein HKO64_00200 [Xanthomonadales bacterium]|nr:hypothetical protein [Gammaproteobacteria bacterium]NNL94015.1 hypothetical protein [Xanthomonadales bacterium]
MILQSIASNLRKQNWSVLFVELIVVIVGLVLAFQADRWWEERGERAQERAYIERLITEVKEDLELVSHARKLAEVRKGFGDLLLEVADDPAAAGQQPAMFLAAIAQAAFTYSPSLTSHTFEELRSTGGMGLINDSEIKRSLYAYYGFHHAQQQYVQLNLMIEMRYFELAANVLDAAQYQWVQDNWFVVRAKDLDEVRATTPDLAGFDATLERFMADEALRAWIPRTRGIQVEQILMNGIRLSRAEDLLAQLDAYAAKLDGN